MKIAVFSDVHSNLLGLQAVLKDIESRDIDLVFCAGDLVGYGPHPNEVIQLLQQKNIPTVMGNYDDAIGNSRIICGCDYKNEQAQRLGEGSIRWTSENTTPESKAWLSKLPHSIEFTAEGLRLKIVHGSPRQLNEYLFEQVSDEYLEELLAESQCDVLICGHTHLPYQKNLKSGYVVNTGSAGKPKHGNPNVSYVILNLTDGKLDTEIVQVPYDFEKTAQEIESVGLPVEFAEIIRTGKA